MILTSHERWDGKGYPFGLSGEQIPLLSRILAILVAFDVMTHDREFKQAISEEEALKEIRINSGRQFDPHFGSVIFKLLGKASLVFSLCTQGLYLLVNSLDGSIQIHPILPV